MRNLILALALLAPCCGCKAIIESFGYTVVDEELQQVDGVRDAATQRYVEATLPLLDKGFEGDKLAEMRDLGATLARVSKLEHELISGVRDGD